MDRKYGSAGVSCTRLRMKAKHSLSSFMSNWMSLKRCMSSDQSSAISSSNTSSWISNSGLFESLNYTRKKKEEEEEEEEEKGG